MKPGDTFTGESGQTWVLGPMIAYQGKADCMVPTCRRRSLTEPGCVDYHCPTCHAPTGSQGHKCPERGEA